MVKRQYSFVWIISSFLVVLGCSNQSSSEAQTTSPKRGSSSQEVANSPTASNPPKSPTDSADLASEDSEVPSMPQAITGMLLTCNKPHVKDLALNIDCLIKDKLDQRVKASSLGSKVDYGIKSEKQDNDVLVSVLEAEEDQEYDVRYAVRAKDLSKIEKVIDSSTFFVRVFDDNGDEIKDAVKPFLGIDLEFPTWDEIKDKLSEGLSKLPF